MTSKKDWLLLALASADDGRMSPVQIQKAMFLMSMEAPQFVGRQFYKFEPYDYGPFDSSIYSDVQSLERDGAVVSENTGRRWRHYMITPTGLRRAKQLNAGVNVDALEFLTVVVAWVKSQTFAALLRAIYEKYPNYAKNSVFVN